MVEVKKFATLYETGGGILNIGLAIRNYVVDKGIKQTFIAEKCGWSKQKVNRILRGGQKIGADEYGAICEAIGAPYDYFYIHDSSREET